MMMRDPGCTSREGRMEPYEKCYLTQLQARNVRTPFSCYVFLQKTYTLLLVPSFPSTILKGHPYKWLCDLLQTSQQLESGGGVKNTFPLSITKKSSFLVDLRNSADLGTIDPNFYLPLQLTRSRFVSLLYISHFFPSDTEGQWSVHSNKPFIQKPIYAWWLT